jgi:hypothetical protein
MNERLIVDQVQAKNRLAGLILSRELLIDVIDAMVSGRANCTNNDPPAAPGFISWSYGTRRMREVLIPLGWEKCDDDQIASAYHKALNIKLVVCNTDEGTGLADSFPQQRSKKGPGTERTVSANQSSLGDILSESTLNGNATKIVPFPVRADRANSVCWFLCVFDEGEVLRAELSCPSVIGNGFFKEFYERILLFGKDDDYKGIRVPRDKPVDDPDFEINVTKK